MDYGSFSQRVDKWHRKSRATVHNYSYLNVHEHKRPIIIQIKHILPGLQTVENVEDTRATWSTIKTTKTFVFDNLKLISATDTS